MGWLFAACSLWSKCPGLDKHSWRFSAQSSKAHETRNAKMQPADTHRGRSASGTGAGRVSGSSIRLEVCKGTCLRARARRGGENRRRDSLVPSGGRGRVLALPGCQGPREASDAVSLVRLLRPPLSRLPPSASRCALDACPSIYYLLL